MAQLYRRKGDDMLVNTQTANNQGTTALALLQDGGYVVTWTDNSLLGGDSSVGSIKGQRFDSAGNKAGGEFIVNSTTLAAQTASAVATLASGRFVVTWTDSSATGGDTSSSAIRGQLFEADGTPVGSEFLVNTQTANGQVNSSIAELAAGGFVVSWADSSLLGGDPSGSGIKAQLFDSAGAKVGGEILVNTSTDGNQSMPNLVALSGGGFAAVWTTFNSAVFPSVGGTRLQLFDSAGAKVGGEQVVNATDGPNFSTATITALAGGGLVVTWTQQDNYGAPVGSLVTFDVRAQIYDSAGAKVGSEFVVNPSSLGNQTNAESAALPGGGFIVTWQGAGEGDSALNVYGQIFDAAGVRQGAAFILSSVTTVNQQIPDVIVLPSGDIVVTWSDGSQTGGDSSGFAVKAQILTLTNDAPTDIALSNTIISETAQEGGPLAVLRTTGALNSAFQYTIISDSSGGAFGIVGDRLVVLDNSLLDFETAPQVQLRIRTTDDNGRSYEETIQLTLSDVPETDYAPEGNEFLLNTTTQGNQGWALLTELASGGYLAQWSDWPLSGSGGAQKGQIFDSGGNKVGGEILVPGEAAAALPGGGFITTWTAYTGQANNYDIRAQIHDASGSPVGAVIEVNTNVLGYQVNPAVATFASGGFMITWMSSLNGNSAPVHGQFFDATGAKLGSSFQVSTYPAGEVEMATLESGNIVVVWSGSGMLAAQMFTPDGFRFGTEFQVDTEGFDLIEPRITPLAGGGFAVSCSGGYYGGIYLQTFDANGVKVGNEVLVTGDGPARSESNDIAALPWGGFIVTWCGPEDDNPSTNDAGIWAQVFDSTGQKVGPQLAVNQTTLNDQWAPEVVVLPSGDVVISWTDLSMTGGDSSGQSVKARVFSLDGTPDPTPNVINGDGGDNILTGTAGEDIVNGLGGNDTLDGAGGDDDVNGGEGNDRLIASGFGNDSADGGAGTDTLVVNYGNAIGNISMASPGTDHLGGYLGAVVGAGWRIDYTGIEKFEVTTGSGNDSVAVRGSGNIVSLGGGNDVFVGAGGNDAFSSEGGVDSADGGDGTDSASVNFVGTAGPILWNLATNSYSGPGSYTNFESFGSLTTGAGNDVVVTSAADLADRVTLGAGDDSVTVANGFDFVDGRTGNDDLLIVDYSAATGSVTLPTTWEYTLSTAGWGYHGRVSDGGTRQVEFWNIDRFDIRTGSGNDNIKLGIGPQVTSDIVSLGAGNDFVNFGRGVDTGDGGSGDDGVAADFSLAPGPIAVNLALGTWSIPAGASFVNFEYLGRSTDRFLTGDYGDVIVTGSASLADYLSLGGGDDRSTVINGLDNVDGGAGTDWLVIDYSAATAGVTTTGGAGGITYGSVNAAGLRGQIGDGGGRRIDFDNMERFDVRTGSGNDSIVLGTGTLASSDIVSLGGGDDFVDFGRGVDVGDGGSGVDGLAADISLAGPAISINLVANSFSGPAGFSFVNFEYFGGSGFHTGQGADTVVTAMLNLNDVVALGQGNDSVTLYDGQDSVFGGLLNGGSADSGFDTLILDYSAATNAVHNVGALQSNGAGAFGQIGDDSTRLATFQAIDRFLVTTGSGNDTIATAGGNDEIRTGGGTDTLSAGGGDDLLDGGSGADSMTGGAGNDIYVVDAASDSVIENAGEGDDTVRTSLAVYSLAGLANVENITGTSAAGQTLTGNSANNLVNAGSGNDVLHLWAGGGNDTVNAGAGNDNIFFGATLTSADVVNGGAGVDTLVVQGPYGSLTLTANITQIENVSILGGNNINFGEPGTNRYDYVLTTNDANFAAGVQARINGAALLEGEDFTFDGSAETDASYVVYGGKGRDTLLGGLGNDIFFYAEERFASGDTVNGGAGYDGMFLRGNYTIDFNAPGYTGLFTNIENLTLTSATDERYARGGGTEFDYNLVLSDAIVNAGQQLTVSGALLMATETMILDASQETDGMLRLFGGAAADTLKGGALADFIHGNFGADTLAGGGGADVFRYQSVTESYSVATDHILDFTPGTDKIELDRIDANTALGGDQAFTWIGSNAFSNQAGQLRAFQSGAQWIVEGDINGDGFADLIIALTLQGPTPLSAGDFVL